MPGAAAVVADDRVRDVGLVGALPRLVSGRSAVRAARTELALAECAVQHGQFAQLHLAQVVLVLGYLDCFFNDLLDLNAKSYHETIISMLTPLSVPCQLLS